LAASFNESCDGASWAEITGRRLNSLTVTEDGKEFLVIELKRGRATDHLTGQILRCMRIVSDEPATSGQMFKGTIKISCMS